MSILEASITKVVTSSLRVPEVGRVVRNSAINYSYEYTLNDHLGNGRVFFNINSSGVATKIQEMDYYAFGLDIQRSLYDTENKYQYNGKEKQDHEKMFDYGARFYDPVIGRWDVGDPLAEDYSAVSPYNYVLNNPINSTDPDGMSVEERPHYIAATYVGPDGKIIRHDNDPNDKNVYLVSNPENWDGTKDGLTILGTEIAGKHYLPGSYVAKIGFNALDLDEVEIIVGADTRMAMIAMTRIFGAQTIGQSYALDALVFPTLRPYFEKW